MEIQIDGNGSHYIEWHQANGWYKRAWVQRKTGEKDWAGTGRYLNVVRCNRPGQTGGNPTDFPVFNDLPDDQILLAFVHGVNAMTGCRGDSDANRT
ncbi:hypothetical protein RFM68_02510 [Mesorhizobium sp. MSK_1335]|uniref:Uncharacterized protein n=1 Tax=Mesorhizobium montanum TaxID=3072323 RepID=A0ABU4ZDF8_9HYPH|nr:hypothetical protein [Mesorhizobium sp. MSK_1335]MDX8523365.1 hypothetical protein [Mesorhizobium sp. MSK_1335]